MTARVDLRSFSYALEPLLLKQQWRLDAAQAKLGQIEGQVAVARRERELAQAALDDCARGIRAMAGAALDPAAYSRSLLYLADLQAGIAEMDLRLERLQRDRQALREDCMQAQRKVDVTSAHKDECVKEYILSEQNRISSETDRDWLARASQASATARAAEENA